MGYKDLDYILEWIITKVCRDYVITEYGFVPQVLGWNRLGTVLIVMYEILYMYNSGNRVMYTLYVSSKCLKFKVKYCH